ncbi:MAG TPA: hypothetical protein VGI24_06585 [Solirubrobacteraceae bacterium]|jgi:hypothetical protein
MAVKIKLSTGEEIVVRGAALSEINEAFSRALAQDQALEIRNSSGRVLALNPRQILSLEQVLDPALAQVG